MQEFWRKIKYSPEYLPSLSSEQVPDKIDDIQFQIGGSFTPKVKSGNTHINENSSKNKCTAVKWFPKRADHGEIKQFLVNYGLPEEHSSIKR